MCGRFVNARRKLALSHMLGFVKGQPAIFSEIFVHETSPLTVMQSVHQ